MGVRFPPRAPGPVAQLAEQLPLKESVERSTRSGITKKEIESEVGAALAAPASADSAAKAKFKSAESRRKKE